MSRFLALAMIFMLETIPCHSQDITSTAIVFIGKLDSAQRSAALYPFDTEERYQFHYFPIPVRKGVALDQLTAVQKDAAYSLMKTCLSDQSVKKVEVIMQLENVLKKIEQRKPEDRYRDPGKYYFAIFGIPGEKTIWGWRLDGHHICFSFSVQNKQLVAGTPGFLGSNPAVVQDGEMKGTEVLQDEKKLGFALLHSLSPGSMQKAILQDTVPYDIMTYINRKAAIEHPAGLRFSEMSPPEQENLLQLISLYVHRYTKLFAERMLKDIQTAGLGNLMFSWIGSQEPGLGRPHYYRIQGPTLIIEYDNTQNNANHIHTVVRDLIHDFGGDELLRHYKESH